MKVIVAVWMLFGLLGTAVAAPGMRVVGTVVSPSTLPGVDMGYRTSGYTLGYVQPKWFGAFITQTTTQHVHGTVCYWVIEVPAVDGKPLRKVTLATVIERGHGRFALYIVDFHDPYQEAQLRGGGSLLTPTDAQAFHL